MKIFIPIIISLTLGRLNAQMPGIGCPKIIYNSYQISSDQCDSTIRKVGRVTLSNKLFISYKDGSKQYVSGDSIWGIRNKNSNPLRIVDKYFYELYELSPVYKYSRHVGKNTHYYFSTSLDGPLYNYTQKQLQKQTDSATYNEIVKQSMTKRHEVSIDFFALRTSLLNNYFWGVGLNMKYYPTKKWGTGISVSGAWRNISETFSFSIGIPTITYTELGWLNQYDIVQANKLRIVLMFLMV